MARGDFEFRNGRRVVIRPIEPSDAGVLSNFHEHLSAASIHNRFFGAHPHLTPREASSFATIDHERRMAFVALDDGAVVGVGRYEGIDDQTVAEVAFVVADDLQRQGLSTIFLDLLVDHARAKGYAKFVAQVLVSNLCMREVFAHSGLSPLTRVHMGVVDVVLELSPEPVGLAGSATPTTHSRGYNHD